MNLDAICARYGSRIVTNEGQAYDKTNMETMCRNSMGVLQEEGIYAFFIFLKSKGNDECKIIWKHILDLFRDNLGFSVDGCLFDPPVERNLIIELECLTKVMLMLKLIKRTMTYALYGVRSIS